MIMRRRREQVINNNNEKERKGKRGIITMKGKKVSGE